MCISILLLKLQLLFPSVSWRKANVLIPKLLRSHPILQIVWERILKEPRKGCSLPTHPLTIFSPGRKSYQLFVQLQFFDSSPCGSAVSDRYVSA